MTDFDKSIVGKINRITEILSSTDRVYITADELVKYEDGEFSIDDLLQFAWFQIDNIDGLIEEVVFCIKEYHTDIESNDYNEVMEALAEKAHYKMENEND